MFRTREKFLLAAAGASLLLTVIGCQSWKGSKDSARTTGGANGPTAADIKFETSEDPPIKAKTRFAAGQVAESRKDLNSAIEQYWAAVKIEPKYREPLYRLGIVYCELKHYPDAIVAWKQYIKAADNDATGYSNLGFCYELSGRHTEAEDAYRKGIDRDPKNNPCRVNYGLMLARDGRTTEAVIQLQAVLTPAEVQYNLASIHEQQGRREVARAEYRKALNLDPSLFDAEVRLSAMR